MERDNNTFLNAVTVPVFNSQLWIVDYVKDNCVVSTGVSKSKKIAEAEAMESKVYASQLEEFNPFLEKNVKSLPQYQSLIRTLLTNEMIGDYEFFPVYFPEKNETLCIIVKTNELGSNWHYFSKSGDQIDEQIRNVVYEFYRTHFCSDKNQKSNIKLYEWLKLWYARLEVYKG